MKKDTFPGKPEFLRYLKGSSDVISGINKKDAKKIKTKGAIGGNGTYRVPTPASLEIISSIEGKTYFVNIKNLIKTELNFKNFSSKRIEKLKSSILPDKLDFISTNNDDTAFKIDENSDSVKKWIECLKIEFS